MFAPALGALAFGFVLGAGLAGLAARKTLREQRRELGELKDALHRDFIANVSHEFRTPIAAIKGYAESLRMGALENKREALSFVRVIERHAERLSILVENLLEVSSISPKPEDVHVAPLLWRLAKDCERVAAKRKLSIRVKADSAARVVADPDHLAQALRGVIDNAIRFNRDGGSIELEAAGGSIVVRDTGHGIAAEDLPRVFDRFAQRTRPRPVLGGSGIGLSTARTLVEANGGRLVVRSTGPEGTALELLLRHTASTSSPF